MYVPETLRLCVRSSIAKRCNRTIWVSANPSCSKRDDTPLLSYPKGTVANDPFEKFSGLELIPKEMRKDWKPKEPPKLPEWEHFYEPIFVSF